MEKKKKTIPKKKVKEPSPKPVKKSGLVIIHENKTLEPEIDENKYSDKLKSLLNKKKSQTMTNSDVKIRFGWKY